MIITGFLLERRLFLSKLNPMLIFLESTGILNKAGSNTSPLFVVLFLQKDKKVESIKTSKNSCQLFKAGFFKFLITNKLGCFNFNFKKLISFLSRLLPRKIKK